MSKNTGGPAFPGERGHGLTIRDWFAGMAMQGMMTDNYKPSDFAMDAEFAYMMADAMLAEREEE